MKIPEEIMDELNLRMRKAERAIAFKEWSKAKNKDFLATPFLDQNKK